MTVETATYISQLDPTLPGINDPKSEGDDHLRLTKSVLQNQFPNLGAAAVTPTADEINVLAGRAQDVIAITNGSTTGAENFNVVTQPYTDSTTKAASTAMVQAAIMASSGISASLPGQPGNAGKFLRTNGSIPSWDVAGMSLLATLNPANGVSSVSATNLAPCKSLLIIIDNIGISSLGYPLLAALSSDNGGSYSASANVQFAQNINSQPSGMLQFTKTDTAAANKPWFAVWVGAGNSGVVTDTTGIINAIKISNSGSAKFNGTGAIYIYGIN